MSDSQATIASVSISPEMIERARVKAVTAALAQVVEELVAQARDFPAFRQMRKRRIEARCPLQLPPELGRSAYCEVIRLVVRKARKIEYGTCCTIDDSLGMVVASRDGIPVDLGSLADRFVEVIVTAYRNSINLCELKRSVFFRDPLVVNIASPKPKTKNIYEFIRTDNATLTISLIADIPSKSMSIP